MPRKGRSSTKKGGKAKRMAHGVPADTPIFLWAERLLGKPVQVETTTGQVANYLKKVQQDVAKGEDVKGLYDHIYRQALDFNVERTFERMQIGDSVADLEWSGFCDDVLLLCCMRKVLTGADIPIMGDSLDPSLVDQMPVSHE